jgi:hypothetical protein
MLYALRSYIYYVVTSYMDLDLHIDNVAVPFHVLHIVR